MNEWGVVGVIVTLVGLFLTIGAPVIKLNTSITQLSVLLGSLQKDFTALKENNAKSHDRIWQKNEALDTRLDDHETRLVRLEK